MCTSMNQCASQTYETFFHMNLLRNTFDLNNTPPLFWAFGSIYFFPPHYCPLFWPRSIVFLLDWDHSFVMGVTASKLVLLLLLYIFNKTDQVTLLKEIRSYNSVHYLPVVAISLGVQYLSHCRPTDPN